MRKWLSGFMAAAIAFYSTLYFERAVIHNLDYSSLNSANLLSLHTN